MCRLFGTISTQPIDAQYLLCDARKSLLYQSRVDRKRPQGDGWGIGWVERGHPQIIKSSRPLYREAGKLGRAARRVKGKVLIGHVRWASNPMKLPKKELIGQTHTQPFAYRDWLFAHNGTLLIPKEVRAALGPLEKHIQGNNDSEVLFYWLMKHWPALTSNKVALCGRPIYRAIQKSLKNLDAVWKQCRKKYPLYKYPYHGLNWVLTNGKILVAMCYVNPGGFGKARALGRPRGPYYQLHRKLDSEGYLVASEPLDDSPQWEKFHHGEILIGHGAGGQLWRL